MSLDRKFFEAQMIYEKQITDLEAKLAELREQITILDEENSKTFMKSVNAWRENAELKQQLAEKDEEIAELRFQARNIFPLIENLEDKVNQDKISFALEQLEKVKEKIQEDRESLINYNNTSEVLMADGFLCDCKKFIDNQIAELTHQHEDKGE